VAITCLPGSRDSELSEDHKSLRQAGAAEACQGTGFSSDWASLLYTGLQMARMLSHLRAHSGWLEVELSDIHVGSSAAIPLQR